MPGVPAGPVRVLRGHDDDIPPSGGPSVPKMVRSAVCELSSLNHNGVTIGRLDKALYQVTWYTEIFGSY